MTEAASAQRSSRAPFVIGGVLIVALVVIALLAGSGSSSNDGPALSPDSTAPEGTKGLVLLLRSFGGDVRVGQQVPDNETHTALLLRDGLDATTRRQLSEWVRAGNTLVLTDPSSPLSAGSFDSQAGLISKDVCDIDRLADAQVVDTAGAALFDTREGDASCFGDDHDALVLSRSLGEGHVISIGSADIMTNDILDSADNSVLAVRLLLPTTEGESIAILDPNPPLAGETTLSDLISDRVFQAIIQLGVAFVLYALWRSRRVGRPVTEPQPVAIAGSQFVRAVGGLQQRSHATDRAAAALRLDTRRALGERFGVPPSTDAQTMARLVSTRTGLDHDGVAWALGDTPVLDEATLADLAHQLDRIRREALDGISR